MLIIEVADSVLEYDQKLKRDLYAETGVREYWISDIQNDCVIIHRDLHELRYRKIERMTRGSVLTPELLPECHIPVDAILP